MEHTREFELEKLNSQIKENNKQSALLKDRKLKQQKLLNELIDKYKHQAKFYEIKGKRPLLFRNSSLPIIKPCSLTAKHSAIIEFNKSESSRSIAKKCGIPKLKFCNLKAITDQMKKDTAKKHKNAMVILNDNVKLYKDQLKKENFTKTNIVKTKKMLIFDSIVNYQKIKRDQLNNLYTSDIKALTKINQCKVKEMEYWKLQTEVNRNNSFKPKFTMFPSSESDKLQLR